MRKIFSIIFWAAITIIYFANLLFLAYLICRTFNFDQLDWLFDWIFNSIHYSLDGVQLGTLWAIYLFISVPAIALLQKYAKNLANQEVAFPILATIADILGGIFKFIIGILILVAAMVILFMLLLPSIQNGITETINNFTDTFNSSLDLTVQK